MQSHLTVGCKDSSFVRKHHYLCSFFISITHSSHGQLQNGSVSTCVEVELSERAPARRKTKRASFIIHRYIPLTFGAARAHAHTSWQESHPGKVFVRHPCSRIVRLTIQSGSGGCSALIQRRKTSTQTQRAHQVSSK